MPKRERILLAVRELKESPFTAPELRQIAEAAEAHGADQLHYALYTHHRESDQPLTEEIVFGHTKRLRLVLLESGDLRDLDSFPDRDLQTEVWQRGCAPRIIHRCFARTADRPRAKYKFMTEVEVGHRSFGETLVAVCGEVSALRVDRSLGVVDDFGLIPRIEQQRARIISCMFHRAYRRYEIGMKFQKFSENGRYFFTAWNTQSDRNEFKKPWKAFHSGEELVIREVVTPAGMRRDLRLGVVDL